jgi:hypothetical protein
VSLNAGLGITTFTSLAVHPDDPKILLGGAQDNATPVSTGDLENWRNRGGGDGGGVAISRARPKIQYATSQGYAGSGQRPPTLLTTLEFFRTDTGWELGGPAAGIPTPQQHIPPFVGSERLPFVPVVVADPNDSRVLYTGTQFLWRLNDTFPLSPWRWTHVGSTARSTTALITAIAVAPSDSRTIYTGSGDGEVWASFDRGATWTRIDSAAALCAPVPGGTSCPGVLSLSVNPNDANDVVVGFGLGGLGPLFRCTAANTASRAWANISGAGATALPTLPINAVVRDPARAATLFVGTDLGLFASEDTGATWANAGTPFGLPNVRVTALTANAATRFLTAATYGRGIWRIDLDTMGLPSP